MEELTDKALHIVILLTQDLRSPSGLGRYFPWAKYLVREGYQVTILALHSDYENLKEKEFFMDGVHVCYVAQMHVRKAENKTHYYSPYQLIRVSLKATSALYEEGLKQTCDLIIIGKPQPMNTIAGLRLARRKAVPVVMDCDDYEAESNHTSSWWQKTVLRLFENNAPKKSNLVTTNTQFMRSFLMNNGLSGDKIFYIPNGVDTERFFIPPKETVEKLRETLGFKGMRVIGYFGSLNLVNHPVDLLVRAFQLVAKGTENVRLLIVGGGKDLENLKEQARVLNLEEKVVFTGRVKPEEMNLYYSLADISVDPVNDTWADRGRCPLKLFESWQMGVPVVSASVGDRQELMGEEMKELLARAGDEESLAEVLKQVIFDPNKLNALKQTVIKRSQEYHWSAIAAASSQLIKDIMDEKTN